MPLESPRLLPAATLWQRFAPRLLLLALALPDLLAPPISPTILRQTQTYAQTVGLIAAGFSPAGQTLDINGPTPFHVVHEFPIYNAAVGSLFLAFGASFFWGKLVSLLATLAGLAVFLRLVRKHAGAAVALRAGLLYASVPILLLLATAFQPDALALLFTLLGVSELIRWRVASTPFRWILFLVCLLAAGLAKFPLVVPFLPLLLAGVLSRDGHWRWPSWFEIISTVVIFLVPFVTWYTYRTRLIDPSYLAGEQASFFVGDLRRFLHASYYAKPVFILGAMVCCGAGVVLVVAGLRHATRTGWLLVAGAALYFVLIPTAADQTYYALPLVPLAALLMAQGMVRLEEAASAPRRRLVRAAIVIAWLAGFAVAAPYTLRQDRVTLDAAEAVARLSRRDDLLFVMNMHDRGVGIGQFNPSIVTLAHRRGWNVHFDSVDPALLRAQIEARRQEGARWVVATWFTPELDPWFASALPASFSRCPRFQNLPVDGQAIVAELEHDFPVAAKGTNYSILRLD